MNNEYAKEHWYSPDVSHMTSFHYVCLARYVLDGKDVGYILLQLGDGAFRPYKLCYMLSDAARKLLMKNNISIVNCKFTLNKEIKPIRNSGIEVINVTNKSIPWQSKDAIKYYNAPKNILDLVAISEKYIALFVQYKSALEVAGIHFLSYRSVFSLYATLDPTLKFYKDDDYNIDTKKAVYFYVDYSDFKATFIRLVNAELSLFDIAIYVLDLNTKIVRTLIDAGKSISDQYNMLEWRITATETNVRFYMCFHSQDDSYSHDYTLTNMSISIYALYSFRDDRIKTMLNLLTDTVLKSRFGINFL